MSRIKINRFNPPKVCLYNPQGEYMGSINIFELCNIRVQIAEQRAEGYYVMWQGEKVEINRYGENPPDSLEGFSNIVLSYTLKLRELNYDRDFKHKID